MKGFNAAVQSSYTSRAGFSRSDVPLRGVCAEENGFRSYRPLRTQSGRMQPLGSSNSSSRVLERKERVHI